MQLYNAYVETQDQLLLEKLENKRINKYLDEIVQEVEAKAPILKRQREEFERSQKAVASLSAKLEQAMKVSIKGKKKSTKNMKKRKKKKMLALIPRAAKICISWVFCSTVPVAEVSVELSSLRFIGLCIVFYRNNTFITLKT